MQISKFVACSIQGQHNTRNVHRKIILTLIQDLVTVEFSNKKYFNSRSVCINIVISQKLSFNTYLNICNEKYFLVFHIILIDC